MPRGSRPSTFFNNRIAPANDHGEALKRQGSARVPHEIYKNALLMIDSGQGDDPDMKQIYAPARELIEAPSMPQD